jgi:hypothetical protein
LAAGLSRLPLHVVTNATAFSPTDTMPLTQTAKIVMGVQSAAALLTAGLVVARAVNILG